MSMFSFFSFVPSSRAFVRTNKFFFKLIKRYFISPIQNHMTCYFSQLSGDVNIGMYASKYYCIILRSYHTEKHYYESFRFY